MDVGSYYFVLDMPIPPWVYYMCKLKQTREGHLMIEKLEALLEWGGTKRDIVFLIISGIALVASIAGLKIGGVDPAWVAIILCGIPIILEAIIGLVTAFDIKADVLVLRLARLHSLCSWVRCWKSSLLRVHAPGLKSLCI